MEFIQYVCIESYKLYFMKRTHKQVNIQTEAMYDAHNSEIDRFINVLCSLYGFFVLELFCKILSTYVFHVSVFRHFTYHIMYAHTYERDILLLLFQPAHINLCKVD